MPRKFNDLTGRKFGRLTVLEFVGRYGPNNRPYWKTICDCGTYKEEQNYQCALSGLSIYGTRTNRKKSSSYRKGTASLDRIDSKYGYMVGNVQWVHVDMNVAKWNLSDQDFIKLCCQVADHNRSGL